jgi:hypothetical protein
MEYGSAHLSAASLFSSKWGAERCGEEGLKGVLEEKNLKRWISSGEGTTVYIVY